MGIFFKPNMKEAKKYVKQVCQREGIKKCPTPKLASKSKQVKHIKNWKTYEVKLWE